VLLAILLLVLLRVVLEMTVEELLVKDEKDGPKSQTRNLICAPCLHLALKALKQQDDISQSIVDSQNNLE
jgi:hypothetical protein